MAHHMQYIMYNICSFKNREVEFLKSTKLVVPTGAHIYSYPLQDRLYDICSRVQGLEKVFPPVQTEIDHICVAIVGTPGRTNGSNNGYQQDCSEPLKK